MADPQVLKGSQPVDLSRHPSGIVPTLQNIVSTVNLDCKLDLKAIALQARNAEYNPKIEGMSAEVVVAKRPVDDTLIEPSGNGKRLKSSTIGFDNKALVGSSSVKVMRLLCPAHKIGGIIGKGGSIIFQISQETGAKVRVEESISGCDERVIIIVGSDRDKEISNDQSKAETKDIECAESTPNPEEHGNADAKQAVTVDSQLEKEKEISSIQKALLVVFDKMVDGLSDVKEGDEGNNSPPSSVVRLLVFSGQVGCLLGKAGSVIKQMASESGAQIRILPKDKLPSCASSSDELVQISGRIDATRKALHCVSQQLLDHYPRNQVPFSATVAGPSSHSFGPLPIDDRLPSFNRPFHGPGGPHSSGFHDVEANNPNRVGFPPEVLSFRLLCTEEKVGSVIGKGGSVVKALQRETGCEVNVVDGGADSEDRIIIVSGPAFPDDRISPPQDAVLRVQSRIFRAAPENKEKTLTAKLLVSSHQIGCLLGKGGSVIAEMRKSTGAYIRILGKDQVPKNASENEEVVQVNGELEVVLEALLQITTKLRNHFFRDILPRNWEQIPPFPLHMNREFSSGMFANQGPLFNNYDGPRGPPLGDGFHAHDNRPPFAHDAHPPFAHGFPRPGFHHISERMPSASMWGPEGHIEGPNPIGFHDYSGPPLRRPGGFAGNQQAIITSTKVEVVVPRFVVPAIYGVDGGCLRQIREISDAKITIMDSKPGTTETTIIISGTPEQANAAQSLIQAFVISETEQS